MAIDTTVLNSDLGYMIDDLPTGLQCAGVSVSGAWTDLVDGSVLEPGGFDPRSTGSWTGQLSDFATTPTAGLTAYTRSKYMRISDDGVHLPPDGISIVLDLEPA